MYEYRAKILSVYDGDTVRADLDLGFGVELKNQKLRLRGIDTPELTGSSRAEGIRARDALRAMIDKEVVTVTTHKDRQGKYGRYLVEIWWRDANVNHWLIQNGYAKPYDS